MELSGKTKVNDLLKAYPFLEDFLPSYNPAFNLLKKKSFRMTLGRFATLRQASAMSKVPLNELLAAIRDEIKKRIGAEVQVSFGRYDDPEVRKKVLKEILQDLHKGENVEEAKKRFHEFLQEVDPSEIGEVEEALVREGLPVTEIQRLCDVHVEVMKESLEQQELPKVEPGHPVHTYMAENEVITRLCRELDARVKELAGDAPQEAWQALENVVERLSGVETHYVRKENQLFPFLEKHGITGPPKVMWGVHDEIRALLKSTRRALEERNVEELRLLVPKLTRAIVEMVFKENKILFPMALQNLNDEEWAEMRRGEREIGYPFPEVSPEAAGAAATASSGASPQQTGGALELDVGTLSAQQLNAVLRTLPVEITFVDDQDTVRYYSDTPKRIFPRSRGVIGRTVQNCHPPKSVHMVERILEAFKSGRKDKAEFWIEHKGAFVHIAYYAVRDRDGKYLGTLEVTQDITELRKLEGEKRLLDWEDA